MNIIHFYRYLFHPLVVKYIGGIDILAGYLGIKIPIHHVHLHTIDYYHLLATHKHIQTFSKIIKDIDERLLIHKILPLTKKTDKFYIKHQHLPTVHPPIEEEKVYVNKSLIYGIWFAPTLSIHLKLLKTFRYLKRFMRVQQIGETYIRFFKSIGLGKYHLYAYMNDIQIPPLNGTPKKSLIDIYKKPISRDICLYYENIIIKHHKVPNFYYHCKPLNFCLYCEVGAIERMKVGAMEMDGRAMKRNTTENFPFTFPYLSICTFFIREKIHDEFWRDPFCVDILIQILFNFSPNDCKKVIFLLESFINSGMHPIMLKWIIINLCDLHNDKKFTLFVIHNLLNFSNLNFIDELIDRYFSADELENYISYVCDQDQPNGDLLVYFYIRNLIAVHKPVYKKRSFIITNPQIFGLTSEEMEDIESIFAI